MTDYLTVAEVIEIHKDLICRYGGILGVGDLGQLEAALFRPQNGYYTDVIAQAAALWESLSQNHPFIDGNKRTAFAGMYAFLAVNGIRVIADADETWHFLAPLYQQHGVRFEVLEAWLRRNTHRVGD